MNTSDDEVLVVDDDPDMAEAIVMVLTDAGYSAVSASNGKQALDAVAAHRPALILLDMLMPVMDGWTFARELRARYPSVPPIVVVTAAEHVRARSHEIGADDVLSKPFDVDALVSIVRRHISSPSRATPAAR